MPVGTPNATQRRKIISSFGAECLPPVFAAITANLGGPASGNWTANRAIYMPFVLRQPFVVQKMAVHNGSTVTGNIDLGIYSENGVKLWSSGSTAQAGTDVYQVLTPGTPVRLTPGRYYMAMAASSTSPVTGRLSVGDLGKIGAVGIQASAFPLPSTMTLATPPTGFRMPHLLIGDRTLV